MFTASLRLFESLIIALRRLEITPKESLTRVLAWQGRDDYGYCDDLGKEIIDALNSKEILAYRGMLEKQKGHSNTEREILKGLYKKENDVDAYIQLCQTTTWKVADFYNVAVLYEFKERYAEALDWLGRASSAMALEKYCSHSNDIEKLEKTLLKKLGRGEEAFKKAWDNFVKNPSEYTYEDVMENFPSDTSKEEWFTKALEIIKDCSFKTKIDFYAEFNEVKLLADLVSKATNKQLESLSHYQAEPIAKALQSPYPLVAAKLFKALGMRIVNNKKSKYYENAVEHLYEAKLLYEAQGRPEEWECIVHVIMAEHKRKYGFMSLFEKVMQGKAPYKKSSFQDKINSRIKKYTKCD